MQKWTSELHEVALVGETVGGDVAEGSWHNIVGEDRPLGQIYFEEVEDRLEVLAHGFVEDAVFACLLV